MNIFSRENMGGMINSVGFREQDCAALIYMFRYLDEDIKYVAFEREDDFTIDFNTCGRLYVQVKVNIMDIRFLRDMVDKYYKTGKHNLFVCSGMDDDVRNLLIKKEKYIVSKEVDECEEYKKQFQDECKKYKIEFEKLEEIEIDVVDSFNAVRLAKNEINEWAEKHCLFIDAQKVLEELVYRIAMHLRPYGGTLSKNEIIACICKNKTSKISSLCSSKEFADDKKNILTELERLMIKHNREYDRINVVKYEVESDKYYEALNNITDLFEDYYDEYKYVYLWLLCVNGQYDECCSIVERTENAEERIKIEYLEALYQLNRYEDVITVASNMFETYRVLLYLARSYIKTEQKQKAEGILQRCAEMQPDRADAYYYLSRVYEFVSDKSTEYINKAINIEPQNALAYLQKGKLKRYKGKYDDAIVCFEKYVELSGDHYNEFVLRELALSSYNGNYDEFKIYFSRWIDRFVSAVQIKKLLRNEIISIVDINCLHTTLVEIKYNEGEIVVNINGTDIFSMKQQERSLGCIGLYVSPVNYSLFNMELEMMKMNEENVDIDDEESVLIDSAIPALIKIFSDDVSYTNTINRILNLNVLNINHETTQYREYVVKDSDIDIKLIKKKEVLDVMINIGGYILDIFVPKINEGYQSFMRKLDGESAYDEAMVMLVSPSETTQITFDKKNIRKIER